MNQMAEPPSAMNRYPDSWELLAALNDMTAVNLKETIRSYNTTPGVRLPLTGTKAEQIQKLRNALFEAVNEPTSNKYNTLRYHIHRNAAHQSYRRSPNFQLWRNSQLYPVVQDALGVASNGNMYYNGTVTGPANPAYAPGPGPDPPALSGWKPPQRPSNSIPANKLGQSSTSSWDPLNVAAKAQPSAPKVPPFKLPPDFPGLSTSNSSRGPAVFKSSPFYTIKEYVGRPITLLENYGTEKKTMTLGFHLNAPQAALLQETSENSNGIKYEMRLFCAKQSLYDQSTYIPPRATAVVEFPSVCEVKVNGTPLSVNLKGSKKSSAKVAPPNLNKDSKFRVMVGVVNKVDIIYTNASSKYTVHAALCTVTAPDTLARRVRTLRFRSKEEVLAGKKKAAEDDDIQAGSSTLSLRCPLTYMRMKSPCRSELCNHTQCFDALSFFEMNQQTPTWICPVCNRVLDPELIILDGYVDDILSRVPESQDSVIVEPDGSWHSSDGKHTSDGKPLAPKSNEKSHEILDSDEEQDQKESPKGKEREVVVIDSSSSPARPTASFGGTSRLSSNSNTNTNSTGKTSRPRSSIPSASNVIDLTLDSDDDEPPARPAKRSRTENSAPQTTPKDAAATAPNGHSSSIEGHGQNGINPTTRNGLGNSDEAASGNGSVRRESFGNQTLNGNVNSIGNENSTGNDAMVHVHGKLVNLDSHPNLKGWTRSQLLDNDQELLKTLLHHPQQPDPDL